jgi:hypothetical protein
MTQHTVFNSFVAFRPTRTHSAPPDSAGFGIDMIQVWENCRAGNEESESFDIYAVLAQRVAHLASRQPKNPRSLRLNPAGFLHRFNQALALGRIVLT